MVTSQVDLKSSPDRLLTTTFIFYNVHDGPATGQTDTVVPSEQKDWS